MANITGTESIDTLTGTAADDIIKGLGGNDRIIGSQGADTIDGGTGNDVLEYTNQIDIRLDPNQYTAQKLYDDYSKDTITNIEKVIGAQTNNSISGDFLDKDTTLDIDLSQNRLTYSSASIGTKTFSFKNFTVFSGGQGNNRLKGDNQDNYFSIGSNNQAGTSYNNSTTMIASKGNDTFTNYYPDKISSTNTTIDYATIGRAETIKLSDSSSLSYYPKYSPGTFVYSFDGMNIDKGGFGIDSIVGIFGKIIGANNKENKIDGSSITAGNLEVNLANNFLKINSPKDVINTGLLDPQYEVVNFVNVLGGKNNDTIVGANKNSKLTGGGGNDTITGGNKNDRITGPDATARGVGECDTLTGGGGRDKFILGDKNGAYYVGKGKDDYALITNFNLFQDSINLGGFKNYSFDSGGNNTIDLYSGKDVNTRDLIAKIQLSGGISSNNANSRSIAGSSPNLDAIISNIDIGSGSDS
jgi:Ca2+-binding RTX toxin-like protein